MNPYDANLVTHERQKQMANDILEKGQRDAAILAATKQLQEITKAARFVFAYQTDAGTIHSIDWPPNSDYMRKAIMMAPVTKAIFQRDREERAVADEAAKRLERLERPEGNA